MLKLLLNVATMSVALMPEGKPQKIHRKNELGLDKKCTPILLSEYKTCGILYIGSTFDISNIICTVLAYHIPHTER